MHHLKIEADELGRREPRVEDRHLHREFMQALDRLDEEARQESEELNGPDYVNQPPHYTAGDVECIEAIESSMTAEEFRGYCKSAALKYIWRERMKGGDESIEKAIWYLNRLLEAA